MVDFVLRLKSAEDKSLELFVCEIAGGPYNLKSDKILSDKRKVFRELQDMLAEIIGYFITNYKDRFTDNINALQEMIELVIEINEDLEQLYDSRSSKNIKKKNTEQISSLNKKFKDDKYKKEIIKLEKFSKLNREENYQESWKLLQKLLNVNCEDRTIKSKAEFFTAEYHLHGMFATKLADKEEYNYALNIFNQICKNKSSKLKDRASFMVDKCKGMREKFWKNLE
ncbi:8958_t:CDS:2 [Racocetra fulgida]|uniref:8958_t:CDS:1 n=1 Tax=Racocetra fulgida TaxID=60492 RepID=A0A9N9FV87_9GLOM|nr:8958_t:CDS:2 [Racocetra fulgida]